MSSKQETVDFVLEQIAEVGEVSAKKMFGEYAVYCSVDDLVKFADEPYEAILELSETS